MASSTLEVKHYPNRHAHKLAASQYQRKSMLPVRIQKNSLRTKGLLERQPRTWPPKTKLGEHSRKEYVNVQYLNNIKSFKDKIKCSHTCNQEQCKMMKERLDEHHAEHHSNMHVPENSVPKLLSDSSSTSRCHEISVSSMESYSPPLVCLRPKESNSVQTDIIPINKPNLQDYSHGPITSAEMLNNKQQTNDSITDSKILKNTDTREVLKPKNDFYTEYVKNETVRWMKKLPMKAETNTETRVLRENILNSLVVDICKLSEYVNDKNYEKQLKLKIDRYLNEMPMWVPGTLREQQSFKDKFSNDLLNNMKNLNIRLFREDKPNSSENRTTQFNDIISDRAKEDTKYLADMNINIIENEIFEWLSNIELEKDGFGNDITKEEVLQLLLDKLEYLLKEPKVAARYKFTLKAEIMDVIKKLSIRVKRPRTKMVYFYRLAEDLANRLLAVQARQAKLRLNKIQNVMFQRKVDEIMNMECPMSIKSNLFTVIGDCLEYHGINHNKELLKEISEIVLESISTNTRILKSHVNDITQILQKYCKESFGEATDIANHILIQVRSALRDDGPISVLGKSISEPRLHGVVSVYTFEERNATSKYPITAIPKKNSILVPELPRQNPDEISLIINLTGDIREWMNNTLPMTLNVSGELGFREAIIGELAGDIVETLRNMQQTPLTQNSDAVPITISNWLVKFRLFDDFERHINEIQDLYRRVFERIKTIPILTNLQQESRRSLEFVPKSIDIIENEISVWMNQQPADMYVNNDKSVKTRLVHQLADKFQEHLVHKHPEIEIQDDIRQWLNIVINPNARDYIPEMTEELRDRLKILPQDVSSNEAHIKKLQAILEKELAKANIVKESPDDTIIENTMKNFIQKFIENYYDVEDQVSRRALTRVLKNELMKLKPSTRKEVYDNFAKSEPNALFAPEQFVQELEYIKLLADWLNMLPVEPSYKALGNKHRVNFIEYVAKYITAIENERSRAPNAMNYDLHLANIIMSYLSTLSMPNEQKVNMARMIDQLLSKLAIHRETIIQKARHAPIINDLGEFIDEYVRKYGVDVYDNEIKLEMWTDRLMKEIQKLVYETSNPAELTQTQVYNRLANVSLPLDDTVDSFVLEIYYVKEIIDWMKNLPLTPIISKEDQDNRVELINELAEKLFDRKVKKTLDMEDREADAEVVQYIAYWLTQLPLERRDEIVVPIVIKQLINRVDRAKGPRPSYDETISDVTRITGKSYPGVVKPEPNPKKTALKNKEYINKPEALIVDTVEKFCNALPVRGDNEDAVKSTKGEILKEVLQKTCELNINPVVFNDPPLYREIFTNEVNEIIESAPLNKEAAKNVEKLREELIETILDANETIKDKSAGVEYKQNLEDVINANLPNPLAIEPNTEAGFEMYKNRLVNMFILENFDHSNEELKLKYERRIRSEIDRYFECAQNRSAIPLTKDQIYNELYSGLFKVPIPNEDSVLNEVEIVKTRCEIDAWFDNLPIREPYNLNEQLEWDQILDALAKRIHDIEKHEQNAEVKILKEINKWLPRLPILPGMENNFDEFANRLQNALKTSAESRKCVPSKTLKGGTAKGKKKKEQVKQSTPVPTHRTNKMLPASKMPCCQSRREPQKDPVELLIDAVMQWCHQLPLLGKTVEELETYKKIREEIFTTIIMKLTELNADSEIFSDNFMYNELLDEELENVLNMIPKSYDVQQSKEARKLQLKQQIASINELIKKERDRDQYKDSLKHTVVSVLEPSPNLTSDKIEMFNNLVEEIVEDFVQLHYNKNDEDGRQYYKSKIQEAILNKFHEIRDQAETEPPANPLIKINQLLCELAKVPIPDRGILKDEVEEIKMRDQVGQFLQQLPFPNKDEESVNLRNQVKLSLAKQLTDIEKAGHNCSSENKMRSEIVKHLKKVNVQVLPQVIDKFVEQLKNNEAERKAPPPEDDVSIHEIMNLFDAVRVRPFAQLPQAGIPRISTDGDIIPRPGLPTVGPRPSGLTAQGTGTRPLAASGDVMGPTRTTRVAFTPQSPQVGRPAAPAVRSSEDEEDDRCKCGGRKMRYAGRRPTCILRRNSNDGLEYCVPVPRMMPRAHFPGFIYF